MSENDEPQNVGIADFASSIVVFLIAVPLAMGIARASGLPAAVGLITAIVGGLVVGLLGGAPLQISGPSAGQAVIVLELVTKYRTDSDPYGLHTIGIVLVIAGALQLIAGVAKWGGYFRAVSPAVIRGMLTGIGVIIIAKQFHVMIDDEVSGGALNAIIRIPEGIFKAFTVQGDRYHYVAAIIGIGTLAVILLWERFRPTSLRVIPGPLLGVVIAALAAAFLALPIDYVNVSGSIADYITYPTTQSLGLLARKDVWLSGLGLAFVATAETLLCATAVSRMHKGQRTDYDRELGAHGIANVVCGVLGAMPVTGVISRSTANVEAGAKTRWSAVMQGIWVLLFVVSFPHWLAFVPESALAAILIYIGFKLLNITEVREMAAFGKPLLFVFFATLVGVVAIDLLTGIVIGLVLSTAKLVYTIAHLDIEREDDGNRIDLHFHGSATFVGLPRLATALEDIPAGAELHVHIEELDFVDHACLDLIASFEKRHEETGGQVILEWHTLMSRYAKGGIRAADRASRVSKPPTAPR